MIFKKIISMFFLLISLSLFFPKIYDLMFGEPDKISSEPILNVISIILSLSLAIVFSLLAYGIYYSKKWSFNLYTTILVFWILIVIANIAQTELQTLYQNIYENILYLIILVVIPVLIEIYLYKMKNKNFEQLG